MQLSLHILHELTIVLLQTHFNKERLAELENAEEKLLEQPELTKQSKWEVKAFLSFYLQAALALVV